MSRQKKSAARPRQAQRRFSGRGVQWPVFEAVVVAVLVVADEDGAALVVAVIVDAPVLLAVSVDAPVVDEAEVSAVLLVDVVVEPQAAIAARAPAAAKLKIKRMAHLSSRAMGTKQPSALNLSDALAQSDKLESGRKSLGLAHFGPCDSALDDVDRESALAGFLVLGRHVQAGLAHGLDDLIE